MYDPYDHMEEADRVDWEVRQHLYAQRRLREVAEIDTKAKVAKMLAEVKPGPKVCTMAMSSGADDLDGKKADRRICGKVATRLIAVTGDWTCADHDALAKPYWGASCCTREVEG